MHNVHIFSSIQNISYSLYTEKKYFTMIFLQEKIIKYNTSKLYDYLVYGVGIQNEVKIFFTKALYLILSIHRRLFYLSFSKYKKRVMRHWETYDISSCQVSKIEFKQRYFFRFYQNVVEDEKLSTLLGVWTLIFTNLSYKHQPLYAQTQQHPTKQKLRVHRQQKIKLIQHDTKIHGLLF